MSSDFIAGLGFKAFRVGGAVRDSLLGLKPRDTDYMLIASPEAIKRAVLASGHAVEDLVVRDRLVGVRASGEGLPQGGIELMPPRIERSIGPERTDFEIVPHHMEEGSDPIRTDALRRDFTINALYEDTDTGQILDPTGHGLEDLRHRALRTTTPNSFRDDPLRIMRGLRLVAQRGFELHPDAYGQMIEHAAAVRNLTTSRGGVSGAAREELTKLLVANSPEEALRLARDTGVLGHFIPELRPIIGFAQDSRYHGLNADDHTFKVVQGVADQSGSLEARLAALFHDSGKPESAWRDKDGRLHFYGTESVEAHEVIGARIARRALKRLNFPVATRERVGKLIENHMLTGKPKAAKARRMRAQMDDEMIRDLLVHVRADFMGKGKPEPDLVRLEDLAQLERLLAEQEGAPRRLADLAVNGDDLIATGIAAGPELGAVLDHLLARVLGDPNLNTRERLLALARAHQKPS